LCWPWAWYRCSRTCGWPALHCPWQAWSPCCTKSLSCTTLPSDLRTAPNQARPFWTVPLQHTKVFIRE
jgi:hypothetical protein